MGLLAARAAWGDAGRTTDTKGAMLSVLHAPFGRVALFIVAIGLIGYAAWRAIQAVLDPEHRGKDAKGLALRASFAVRGVFHGWLGVSAARLAMGSRRVGPDEQPERWTAIMLDISGGRWIIWAIALSIIGFGVYQLYRAWVAKLSKQLNFSRMSAELGRWVISMSRAGIAARGVVFGMIGILLAKAALRRTPNDAGGIADALRSLENFGRWPYLATAIGLIAYGAYELLNARYRRIQVE